LRQYDDQKYAEGERTGFQGDVNQRGGTSQGATVDGQARPVSGRGELDSQSVTL